MTSLSQCQPSAAAGMGDGVWDGCIALNAKRTGSKGYGVSMADAYSAMRPRTVAAGAPQRLRPGAHPFGPSPAAVHGTGPTAVIFGKNPLNRKCRNAFGKKSAIEIDSGASPGTAGERKGLAATYIAEHPVYPRFWGLVPPSELILEVGV